MSHGWAINGPLGTASVGHPRSATSAVETTQFAPAGTSAATFQAGHASSILVTRSTAEALISRAFVVRVGFGRFAVLCGRATHGPLLPRLAADPEVKGSGDLAVALIGRVLVDQRRTHAAVAHSVHQLRRPPTPGCERLLGPGAQLVKGRRKRGRRRVSSLRSGPHR